MPCRFRPIATHSVKSSGGEEQFLLLRDVMGSHSSHLSHQPRLDWTIGFATFPPFNSPHLRAKIPRSLDPAALRNWRLCTHSAQTMPGMRPPVLEAGRGCLACSASPRRRASLTTTAVPPGATVTTRPSLARIRSPPDATTVGTTMSGEGSRIAASYQRC